MATDSVRPVKHPSPLGNRQAAGRPERAGDGLCLCRRLQHAVWCVVEPQSPGQRCTDGEKKQGVGEAELSRHKVVTDL